MFFLSRRYLSSQNEFNRCVFCMWSPQMWFDSLQCWYVISWMQNEAASTTSQWDLKFGEGQTFAKAVLTSDRLKTFSCLSVQENVRLPCARNTHFRVLCAATWQMNPVEVHCRTQRLNFLFFLFLSSLSVQVVMNTGSSSIKGSWRTWKHKGDGCTHEFVLVDFYITMSQVQDVLLKENSWP